MLVLQSNERDHFADDKTIVILSTSQHNKMFTQHSDEYAIAYANESLEINLIMKT